MLKALHIFPSANICLVNVRLVTKLSTIGHRMDEANSTVVSSSCCEYFDAHCHVQLDPLWSQYQSVFESAKRSHLIGVAVSSTCPLTDWTKVDQLWKEYPNFVFPSYGLHPYWIGEYISSLRLNSSLSFETALPIDDIELKTNGESKMNMRGQKEEESAMLDLLRTQLQAVLVENPRAAVGECGLDKRLTSFRSNMTETPPIALDLQIKIFQLHLDASIKFGRPLICHCVGAWGHLYNILHQKYTQFMLTLSADSAAPRIWPSIIFHSCNGVSLELARAFVANVGNVYFSFSGGYINEKVAEVIRWLPIRNILIETDSPDQYLRGSSVAESVRASLKDQETFLKCLLDIDVQCAHISSLSKEINSKMCNQPSAIFALCELVSQIKDLPHNEFAMSTTLNAKRAFGCSGFISTATS